MHSVRDIFNPVAIATAGDRLTLAMAVLAGRLQRIMGRVFRQGEPIPPSCVFLREAYEKSALGVPLEAWVGSTLSGNPENFYHPVDRLAARFALSDLELQLLLLACMADEHEGYAAVLRSLHPRGESCATLGMAAQVLFDRADGREVLRELVQQGNLFRRGVVELSPEGPFFDRSLHPVRGLWMALRGHEAWPVELALLPSLGHTQGLETWLANPAATRTKRALLNGDDCTIAILCEDESSAFHRAVALARAAGRKHVGIAAPAALEGKWQQLLSVHAALRNVVPILRISPATGPSAPEMTSFSFAPGPVLIACAEVPAALSQGRSLIVVPVEPMGAYDRRRMWSALLPALSSSSEKLASRYPIEPFRVAEIASDLELIEALENRPPTIADVAESMRSRARRSLSVGALWVQPTANWKDIVLHSDLIAQLNEAADRLTLQSRVLDDWGFLQDRRGARGVRLLFAGPPGTGKTLAAEVLAHAIHADLLIIDASRVTSKWIGETEKNLAAVFDAAESSQAVLFFDEADSLFAKRTEVSDAHDRYANLETSYLLQRLERFDGLAILATNLKQNIDAAFLRRLEFVLTFTEPDRELRTALWKRHIPEGFRLDPSVNFAALAALYPLVGAIIRNAAVAAAFRAASEDTDTPLSQEHFVQAIRREYEKLGKAFPGRPANMRN